MKEKYFYGSDAAERAKTITDEWRIGSGRIIRADELVSMLQTADSENSVDEDDEDVYYIVTDDGAVGFTSNAERTITWIATPTKEVRGSGDTDFGESRPKGSAGYSMTINDPRFLEAVRKNRKSTTGCAVVFSLVPFVMITIGTIVSGDGDVAMAMLVGGAVAVVLFLIYKLISLKGKYEKPWEGVVENKSEMVIRNRHHSDGVNDYRNEPWGTIIVRGDDGKKHKIEERLDGTDFTNYIYLKVGDRVKFHAGMGLLNPYEKYDKSKDEIVICAFCRKPASVANQECEFCHNPLLK